MCGQQDRHAVGELRLAGLVPERVHAEERADRSEGGGQGQERRFGNAPLVVDGPLLVEAVHGERDDVDGDEYRVDEADRHWRQQFNQHVRFLSGSLRTPRTS